MNDLRTDRVARAALERFLEILSEASRHLPEAWKDASGLRICRGGKSRLSETCSATSMTRSIVGVLWAVYERRPRSARSRHRRHACRPFAQGLVAVSTDRFGDFAGIRGRLTENAPLAPFTWFRVGGPAELLFQPADADDLALFLRETESGSAGNRHRRRLKSAGPRRRHRRRRHPPVGEGLRSGHRRAGQPHPRRRGAARQAAGRLRAGAGPRRLRLLSTAFPARSAGRCA